MIEPEFTKVDDYELIIDKSFKVNGKSQLLYLEAKPVFAFEPKELIIDVPMQMLIYIFDIKIGNVSCMVSSLLHDAYNYNTPGHRQVHMGKTIPHVTTLSIHAFYEGLPVKKLYPELHKKLYGPENDIFDFTCKFVGTAWQSREEMESVQ